MEESTFSTPVTPVTPKKKFPVWAIVLVVILVLWLLSIVCIVLTGALVTVNPSKNISDARNAQRRSDVTLVYRGLAQFLQSQPIFPDFPSCTSNPNGINIGSNKGLVNLTPILVPTYLHSLPLDPQGGTAGDTGYSICMNSDPFVLKVFAPKAENGVTIKE